MAASASATAAHWLSLVPNSAIAAGDLYRDANDIPEPLRSKLRTAIRDFAKGVLTEEWPAMPKGSDFGDDGWLPLYTYNRDLRGFHASDAVDTAVLTESLQRLD